MDDPTESLRICAENARARHDTAKLLLEGGRWPDAFAIDSIAFQEAGKVLLQNEAFTGRASTGDLSRRITDHYAKTEIAQDAAAIRLFGDISSNSTADALDRLRDYVARETGWSTEGVDWEKMRQAALYADNSTGGWRTPTKYINEPRARLMHRLSEAAVEVAEHVPSLSGRS